MFIARGSMEYGWKKKMQALDLVAYDKLRRGVADAVKLPEQAELEKFNEYSAGLGYSGDGMNVDERVVAALSEAGIEVTLKNVKGLDPRGADNIQNIIYQIAVPDIGIMTIKNVDYIYNADLHDINAALDRGWRILCVLPPRVMSTDEFPTYVVGHTKVPD